MDATLTERGIYPSDILHLARDLLFRQEHATSRSRGFSARMLHVSNAKPDDFPRGDETFPVYLTQLLKNLGETATTAARKANIDRSLVSNWKNGKTKPTLPRLRQFADGLDIPRLPLMIRAGLLETKDVGVDDVFLETLELYGLLRDDEDRFRVREHLRFLNLYTRERLDETSD